MVPYLLPCSGALQDKHSSFVEHWVPKKWALSHFEVDRILFFSEWWIKYFDFGLKKQMTIKPGQILVKFKEDEQALHQAELDRERQAKLETRKISARQNAAKALAEAVAKQTKSLIFQDWIKQKSKTNFYNK